MAAARDGKPNPLSRHSMYSVVDKEDHDMVTDYLLTDEAAQRELMPLLVACAKTKSPDVFRELVAHAPQSLKDKVASNLMENPKTASGQAIDDGNDAKKRWTAAVKKLNQGAGLLGRLLNQQRERTYLDEPQGDQDISQEDWRFFVYQAERHIGEKTLSLCNQQHLEPREGTDGANHLYSFLPKMIKHMIKRDYISTDDNLRLQSVTEDFCPYLTTFDAVVVFADASGFTRMTEQLAKKPNGAELIGKGLNSFFNPIIELVELFGADILKFSGDAITIIWPASSLISENAPANGEEFYSGKDLKQLAKDIETLRSKSTRRTMRAAVHLALECCDALHKRVERNLEKGLYEKGAEMALHIGMGCGPITVLQCGGLLNRWEYLVTGDPLDQISIAEPLATINQTVISPECVQFIDSETSTRKYWGLHDVGQGCKLVRRLRTPSNMPVPPFGFETSRNSRTNETPRLELNQMDIRLMRRFIPFACWRALYRPIKEVNENVEGSDEPHPHHRKPEEVDMQKLDGEKRMTSSMTNASQEESFLEEMRVASIVFLNIQGIQTEPGNGNTFTRVQTVVSIVQRAIYAQEGSLNKCLLDDKGFLILCAFGLPPMNHVKDDPLRATLFGIRVVEMLAEEDYVARAGVATGLVWCGVVGSQIRREYTVLGDIVNLSARLMANAQENGVLVCNNTHTISKTVLEFMGGKNIKVKGKSLPLKVYAPTGNLYKGERFPNRKYLTMFPPLLWNLPYEVSLIMNRALRSKGIVSISGAAGSGKGAAAEFVNMWAQKNNFVVLNGGNISAGNTFTVPLQPWQQICSRITDLASEDPYWKSKVEIKQRQLLQRGRKTESNNQSFLYLLLMSMLEMASKEKQSLIPWIPLCALVINKFEINNDIVQSMREADLDQGTNSRFGELVTQLIRSFAERPSADGDFASKPRGTVIVTVVNQGTSFYDVPNGHAKGITEHVMKMCSTWDNSKQSPLIYVYVSRERFQSPEEDETAQQILHNSVMGSMRFNDVISDRRVSFSNSTESIHLVLQNLPLEDSKAFASHFFAVNVFKKLRKFAKLECHKPPAEREKRPSLQGDEDIGNELRDFADLLGVTLPAFLFEYIYSLTQGNMTGMEILCTSLLDKKVVVDKNSKEGNIQLNSEIKCLKDLHQMEPPFELMGMMLFMFEKFANDVQIVIKNAAMFDSWWTVENLSVLMKSESLNKLRNMVDHLTGKDIFTKISGTFKGKFVIWYKITSPVLKRVASNLVLKHQQNTSKDAISRLKETMGKTYEEDRQKAKEKDLHSQNRHSLRSRDLEDKLAIKGLKDAATAPTGSRDTALLSPCAARRIPRR